MTWKITRRGFQNALLACIVSAGAGGAATPAKQKAMALTGSGAKMWVVDGWLLSSADVQLLSEKLRRRARPVETRPPPGLRMRQSRV